MATRRRLSRAEQKALTRERLLDAAWEVFVEKGYEATSLDEVAERAGYTRTPLHANFGDKQGLFFALWLHVIDLDLHLSDLVPEGMPLRDWITSAASLRRRRAHLSHPDARVGQELGLVVHALMVRNDGLREAFELEMSAAVARVGREIAAHVARTGEVLAVEPEKLALMWTSLLFGMSSLALYPSLGITAEDIVAAQRALLEARPSRNVRP